MRAKYVLIAVFASTFFIADVLTQEADSNALNQQMLVLVRQGKLVEAIPIAEKIAKIEKSKSPRSESYAAALTNLGALQREVFRQAKLNDIAENQKLAERAERNFRASLEIYQSRTSSDNLEAAAVKNELAWLLDNHLPARAAEESRARIDEAEKLYLEALAVQERLSGPDSDVTLTSVLSLGDFYTRWINFEKALPFYERYVAAVEKKEGLSAKTLVPGLRGLLEILVITMQDDAAKEMANRIGAISGRDEPIPNIYPQLSLRARQIDAMKEVPRPIYMDPRELFPSRMGPRSMSPTDDALRGVGQMGGGLPFRQTVVAIVVDEEGNVIQARILDPNAKDVATIEKAVRRSKFRPFIYKGVARKMRGAVYWIYRVK